LNKQKAIQIGGISVDLYTENEYKSLLSSAIEKGEKRTFFHTNAHLVVLANTKFPWLKKAFHSTVDYVMCDSSGIQLACSILGKKIPEKVAYNVWFWDFAKFCAEKGYRIFFLGAKKEVVEKAAKNMKAHAPGLQIETHHGYFNHKDEGPENDEIKRKINSFDPQVLLVGLGMPMQESWILRNMKDLGANALFPCGGAFDFFAREKKVAPNWVRQIKLEWLFRMGLEPFRLGRRYLVENPQFIYYVLKNR
jgi:N-acetylglucosaminyldiphosphoundecaprenol N-acetyl-beta-D-mannosaminyltransferase